MKTALEIVNDLNTMDTSDPESAHAVADDFLLDAVRLAGMSEVADAYMALVSRCSWWACA